jgi:predicted glycoside hydrolase/deacetylase ChbG (UPF0249 family)
MQPRQVVKSPKFTKRKRFETRHSFEDGSLLASTWKGGFVDGSRYLIVTADDFGVGPATSHGILELASDGLVTCTVLLVNSPYAAGALQAWKAAGRGLEVGWHPCLTLDRPILSASQVSSLVRPDGTFWPLGTFVRRLNMGAIGHHEIHAELTAQCQRFVQLVGHPPTAVNTHHHIQVFPPVGQILLDVLRSCRTSPYVRRIREPWPMLTSVPGARIKRLLLSTLGRPDAARQVRLGFPGNDWLAGITDPPCVKDPQFLARWLARIPGRVVELTCHPGHRDETLLGRDASESDGQMQRRVDELHLLRQANFREACRRAGFTLISPRDWLKLPGRGVAHAA